MAQVYYSKPQYPNVQYHAYGQYMQPQTAAWYQSSRAPTPATANLAPPQWAHQQPRLSPKGSPSGSLFRGRSRSSDGRRDRGLTPPFEPLAHPELDHSLSADLCVHKFDVRLPPKDTIPAHIVDAYGRRPAVTADPPATHIRLISKAFPWTIDVQHTRQQGYFGFMGEPDGKPITCEYLWRKIYQALQEPVTHAEWAFIAESEGGGEKAEAMKAAAEARKEEGRDAALTVRRVVYLGEKTIFRGLKKSDDLVQSRALPGEDINASTQTWVLKFVARA